LAKKNASQTFASASRRITLWAGSVGMIAVSMISAIFKSYRSHLILLLSKELSESCTNKQECLLANGVLNRVDCVSGNCACTPAFKADVSKNLCNSGTNNIQFLLGFSILRLIFILQV
jgi:hypothetical protein